MYFADGLWAFVTRPLPVFVLVVAVALCWPLGGLLARRCRCPHVAAALFIVSVGVVVALTLTPDPPPAGQPIVVYPHFLTLLHSPGVLRAQLFGAPADLEQIANIALYVPIGVCCRLINLSVVRSTLVGLAFTSGVELSQYDIVGRAGSLTDIRNNTLGALAGAAFTALAIRLRPGSR